MPELTRRDDVYVLDLGADENRFGPDWLSAVEEALDELEATTGPVALVTTAGPKYYSTGLDLDQVEINSDEFDAYLDRAERLFARFLVLPMITVAAVSGHAFGAGAMLALSHDFRVMRADRGFWCLPEVDLGLAFTPGMTALIRSRLAPQVAHEAMVTGRRYGGVDAQALGIIDHAVTAEQVLETALEIARASIGKAGATLGAIKAGLYAEALAALREPGSDR